MKRWEHDFIIGETLEHMQHPYQRVDAGIHCPPEIVEWAAQLKLLTGVPLSCLVGDEKQLLPECIQFFYVDENWTDQLINGALSIGADDTKARSINMFFSSEFHKNGRNSLHVPREKRIHENQKKFYKKQTLISDHERITGFLLRSRLVKLWKGLESTALDKTGESISILRMEQLSEEIMICVYRGEIAKLRVKEPKEGLRFGTHENDRSINVRDIKQGNEGRPVQDKKVVIHTNDYGRGDMLTLAADLKKALNTDKFTSAELAMELIVAPGLAEFDRT